VSASRLVRERRDAVSAVSGAAPGRDGMSSTDGILDGMSARMRSPVLVGRAEHLAALDAALDGVRTGGSSTLLIGGEAGIGKSRLVSEFAAGAGAAGARVLTGGCLDLGADGLPFAPFAAVLRELVRDLGADGVAALLPTQATREFARLLPEFGETDREADPAVARARLFEQMLTLLEHLAEAGPVVLIIEDAHWADPSTRDLTAFLIGSQQVLDGVLIVVTYRSDELHRTHPLRPLLAELARLGWVERMELPRLGRLQADELVAHLTGREPERWLADEIYDRGEGNPLFVEELLCCDGGLTTELPESLRDLLLAAVQRLPEETQELLRAASAGGQRTGHALLAAVTGLAGDDLAHRLRSAVAANVLRADEDGYAFRHALIREAVYDDLLPGERTRLHTRFAEVLGSDAGLVAPGRGLIEQAHHYYHAHDIPGALVSAWQAAAAAGHALAHAEQLTLLARVLELWDKVPDASERTGASHLLVLEQAATAAQTAEEPERGIAFASAALKEVDPAAEPVRAALLLETRASLYRHSGKADPYVDLQAALELVPPGVGDAARARVLLSEAKHRPEPHGPQGRAAAEEALSLAQQVGDAATQVIALCELACIESHSGDDAQALEILAGARSLARRVGALRPLLHAAINESHVLEGIGEHEQAAQVARTGIGNAQAYGLARTTGTFLAINVAEPLVSLGRWDEATEVIEHALALSPPQLNRLALRVLAGEIELRRGRLAEARALAAAARTALTRSGYMGHKEGQYYLPLAQLETSLCLADGRPAHALDMVVAAVDGFDLVHDPRYAWPLLTLGARACGVAAAASRDRAAAERADDLFGRLRMLAGKMECSGPVQRASQLTFAAQADTAQAGTAQADTDRVGAGRRASVHWDAAAAAWDRVSQPYQLAVATLRAGEAALAAGDRDDAAQRLRRTAELADGLGAHPLSEEVATLARSARLPMRAGRGGGGPAPGRLGLTTREFEVLRLVAAGRSNPEIAAELYISAKTASVHVSNILAKLGVSGRGEAAAAAHRLGLFSPEPAPPEKPAAGRGARPRSGRS
jgi:DNA-binding CsgD family transcriptional regulator/tetratricopeptide (TPR) repeat protein